MVAHQPHFSYCEVEMVYGIDWPRHLILINPNRKMFYLMFIIIHLYYYVIYFKYIHLK
jgi:hypothetical protein